MYVYKVCVCDCLGPLASYLSDGVHEKPPMVSKNCWQFLKICTISDNFNWSVDCCPQYLLICEDIVSKSHSFCFNCTSLLCPKLEHDNELYFLGKWMLQSLRFYAADYQNVMSIGGPPGEINVSQRGKTLRKIRYVGMSNVSIEKCVCKYNVLTTVIL